MTSTLDLIMRPRLAKIIFFAAWINTAVLFAVSATFLGGIPDPFIIKTSPPFTVVYHGAISYLDESTWRACQWWARISIALIVFAMLSRIASGKNAKSNNAAREKV